ncbi:AraC family transcriptional regulator [Pleurocapsales cyanobacterium LEGE 06147]|nr:AraC family transcriptional regulator [Pleurocapsales cyanobacterium LEGE 06147]
MEQVECFPWEYSLGKPSNTLKGWVCSYSGYREEVGQPVCRLEIPKERVILILGFSGRLHISSVGSRLVPSRYKAFIVGLGENPLLAEHNGAQHGIEIELLPWVIDRLFGRAATELTQEVVHLDDLWGNYAHLLVEQLSEMSSWEERFSLVDRVLLEKFALSNRIIRPEIQWAWNQLEHHKGCIPIRQLAERVGWSDRHFAKCFREQIGITPKAAARLIRFNHAHRVLKSSGHYPLSEIAAICGYSDQSHFTREFHSFSQCSPAVYQNAQFVDLLGTPGDIIKPEARSILFKT